MDDFGSSFATAFSIPATGAIFGTIESEGDLDVFRLDLAAGQSIELRVSSRTDGSTPNDSLRLKSVQIQTLETSRFGDLVPSRPLDLQSSEYELDRSFLNFTAPEAGTYYVTVSGFDETPDDGLQQGIGKYFLDVLLEAFSVDDHGDSARLATAIDGSTTVTGDIGFQSDLSNWDDDDVFAIELSAGERIMLDGRGRGLGSTLGPWTICASRCHSMISTLSSPRMKPLMQEVSTQTGLIVRSSLPQSTTTRR